MPTKDQLQAALDTAQTENTALRQENAILRQLLDLVPDMIAYKGSGSHIHYINQAFQEYYGVDLESAREQQHTLFSEQVLADESHTLATGEQVEDHEELTRDEEVVGWLDTTINPIYDEAGGIIGTASVIRNITQEMDVISALQESEERSQRLLSLIPGMVFELELTTDGTARYLYISPGSVDIYGLTPDDIMRDYGILAQFFEASESEAYHASMQQSAQTLDTWEWKSRANTPSGERIIQGHASPQRLDNGTIRWAGVIFDITKSQQSHIQQQRLADILEALPDLVTMTDLEGNIIYLNKAGYAMLGLTPDDVNQKVPMSQFHPPRTMDYIMETAFPQVLHHGSWTGETDVKIASGEVIPIKHTILRHLDEAGQLAYVSTIMRDLSGERRSEHERQLLQQEVIRAQELAIAELSTPLIALDNRTVLMPLIGTIDSQRSQQIIETLLEGVSHQQAQTAIIDLTGVPVVDTQVASALVRAAQAVRLLGAGVVLTGIRPEIAQTLVSLGVELTDVVTRGNLHAGIQYAMRHYR